MNPQERHRVNRHLKRAHELLGFGTSLHKLPSNQIKQIVDELNCNDSSKFCRSSRRMSQSGPCRNKMKQCAMQLIAHDPKKLEQLPEYFRNDSDIVHTAVLQNGRALKYASDKLKGNRVIVHAAVLQNGLALEYASNDLKGDHKIVYAAVSQDGLALKYASGDLKGDRAIVHRAVLQNGIALRYASGNLQVDRELFSRFPMGLRFLLRTVA